MNQPREDSALVTILVVTYNRLDLTRQCVDSVAEHTPESHRFLFVDNASMDGSAAYLRERFGPEAVLVNDHNEGFLRAANRGIADARSPYLLLLNNDTVVTAGWLSALLGAAERSPDVGIVSGKILGPDGRVQLAGAYVAFDGSARMIGEGLSANDPSIAEEREVCYVGGHCMLIRREVIDAIGPLDESFGFGYHEDTDYCYRARQAGFRVVYTPECTIRHQLFGTPLADRQKVIAENQRAILARWADQLFLRRFVSSEVEFRADHGELPVGGGWFAAERDFTCTGREAWCYLRPPAQGPAVLELVAAAAHPDLSENPLKLEVLAGEQTVGVAIFRTPWEWRQLFFPLPDGAEGPLRIDLNLDRTWTPDSISRDGRDTRQVGLAVRRMTAATPDEAAKREAEGVPADLSLRQISEHLDYLQKIWADREDFYIRELDSRQRLIEKLQDNLERYHDSPPFRLYFGLKRLLRLS